MLIQARGHDLQWWKPTCVMEIPGPENSQYCLASNRFLSRQPSQQLWKGFLLFHVWSLTCRLHVTSTCRLVSAWWIVDFREWGGGTANRMMELYIFHSSCHCCHRLTISVVKVRAPSDWRERSQLHPVIEVSFVHHRWFFLKMLFFFLTIK